MLNISSRLKQILLILLEQTEIISIQTLAEKVKTSKRTVQRELESVDEILKKYELSLQSKTGKGIWVEGAKENSFALYWELKEQNLNDMNNKEERRKQLIYHMLKEKEPQKLFYYAHLLEVSEGTISKDMEAIEEWFSWLDLKIVRKQGYGVELEGSEKGYRLALRRFLDENIKRDIWREMIHYGSEVARKSRGVSYKYYETLIDFTIFDQVILCLNKMEKTKISRMEESSYLSLAMHITIAIKRLQEDYVLEVEENEVEWEDTEEWKLAKDLSEILSNQFHIAIPEQEISYLCLHIKGARLQAVTEKNVELWKQEQLEKIYNKVIVEFDPKMAIYLQKDEEFKKGFLVDIQAMIVRIQNKITIINPLLEQMKEQYYSVFIQTKKALSCLEQCFQIEIPEDEVVYIGMHFLAAKIRFEGDDTKLRKVSIGILCASGIGVSKVMESKLKQYFKNQITITSYALEEVRDTLSSHIDFFVCSFQIPFDNIQKEVVTVSPLLLEEDLKVLEEKVFQYGILPRKEEKVDITFSLQLEEVSIIASEIKGILSRCDCIILEESLSLEGLIQRLVEEVTQDKEEQLQIKNDLLAREKLATQLVKEMEFALLHARTKGVEKPIILFGKTDKEEFIDPYMKGIKAIILMLMPPEYHAKQNGQILGYISSSLVEDTQFLKTIFQGEKLEIKQYLTKLLKDYFNHYLEGLE